MRALELSQLERDMRLLRPLYQEELDLLVEYGFLEKPPVVTSEGDDGVPWALLPPRVADSLISKGFGISRMYRIQAGDSPYYEDGFLLP